MIRRTRSLASKRYPPDCAAVADREGAFRSPSSLSSSCPSVEMSLTDPSSLTELGWPRSVTRPRYQRRKFHLRSRAHTQTPQHSGTIDRHNNENSTAACRYRTQPASCPPVSDNHPDESCLNPKERNFSLTSHLVKLCPASHAGPKGSKQYRK